jgi:hypothetical protein
MTNSQRMSVRLYLFTFSVIKWGSTDWKSYSILGDKCDGVMSDEFEGTDRVISGTYIYHFCGGTEENNSINLYRALHK